MIPWGKLLRSVPVWASAVATMGNQWGDATLALGMTKYLKLIYGFSTANVSSLFHKTLYLTASDIVLCSFDKVYVTFL